MKKASCKKLILFLLMILFIISSIGCGCKHEWEDATCTKPMTCTLCGEVEGEALGHEWKEATCEEPKTCVECGITEGKALGHKWEEATCSEPKTCSVCGKTEGEAHGHEWKEATCTEPKTCSVCGKTEGKALGHDTSELSCTEGDTCSRCGETIPALGHDWKEATCTEPQTCSRCGITEGSALGHMESESKKEKTHSATCTQEGSYDEVVYCSRCHTELNRKTVTEPALGHTTKSGVCSRCGAEVYEPIKGKGDDVISGVKVGDGIYRAHIKNEGRSNFIVWIYDATNDRDLLINEIGAYDGYVFLGGKAPYDFEVQSTGNWSIEIERLTTVSDKSFSGKGDYVTGIASLSAGTYEITHDGRSNFVVWVYTTDGRDLLVNEIGEYSGKKRISIPSESNVVFEITADGNWTITKMD